MVALKKLGVYFFIMIKVLRLGHRRGRDDRISTHVGLTARQWGADEIVYSGEKDSNMIESIEDVVDRWGGNFNICYESDWERIFREFDGFRVVLSMFGEVFNRGMEEIEEEAGDDILVIVGGEKVPSWLYKEADLNLSVGNQPHSEVAALAVFLHEYSDADLYREFEGAEIKTEPRPHGKEVKDLEEESI